MIKKKLTLGLASIVGVSTLFGCGNATKNESTVEMVTDTGDGVEIEFWHSMSGGLGETLNSLVDEFNKTVGEEKGIVVEAIYQGSYVDTKSKVVAAIKSGNAPAVVQATSGDVQEYLLSGTVESLNKYINHEEVGIKDFDDIYDVYKQESLQYDGETYYSLPFSKSTDLLYYNKTFFDEHGLEVPTTWEEMEQVSKQITEITNRPAFGIDNVANFFITGLNQLGGEYTNSNGEILFNNEQAVQILSMLKENIDNGIWRLAGEDGYMSAPFVSGLAPMFIGSSASAVYLEGADFEWETVKTPQFDLNNPAYIQQGNSVAVLNGNKTSEEVYGAYEFVKFLSSHKANLYWTLNTGYLPIRKSVSESEEFASYIEEINDTTKLNGAEQSSHSFVEAAFFGDNSTSNMTRTYVGQMCEEILLAGTDIQLALDTYEAKLQN